VNQTLVRVLAGGKWENTNAFGNKSRTFVRGILPRGKGSRKGDQGAADIELQARGAPPEAIAATVDARTREHGAREFDDDNEVEARPDMFHHGDDARPHWRLTAWEDVRVGDIVKIGEDEAFPADLLICATSEEENAAYVETKNLDGETNLKSRHAVPALAHLRTAAACADPANAFRIECDRPDVNMYKLNAAVVANNEKSPVELSMSLLRGTVLRNTGWVIGVVLFTGEDTKIVLNSGGTPSKRGKVERQMNPQVYV
jgi:phospholipid-translocating ATPase